MACESVQKHHDPGTQYRVEKRSKSPNDPDGVLPRFEPTHTATTDHHVEPTSPSPHLLMKPHRVHQPGQERERRVHVSPKGLSYRAEMRIEHVHPVPVCACSHEDWTAWSSDDVYSQYSELNHDPRCFARQHSECSTLLQLRREPSDANLANLPAYCDPGPIAPPDFVPQTTSDFAKDMPLRKHQHQYPLRLAPVNDAYEKPPPPPRNPKRLTMSKMSQSHAHEEAGNVFSMKHHAEIDETFSTKQQDGVRKSTLNIIRLSPHASRPERKSSLAHATPSPLGSHPISMDTGEFSMPPVPAKSSRRSYSASKNRSNGKDRPFDVVPKDQHKTHVRRPPKGIQHWFDAYISSEEDEDEDDDEDEDEPDETNEPEPQELPADNVLRPYVPKGGSSFEIENPTHRTDPMSNGFAVLDSDMHHSPVESNSSNSIQSSHCRGRKRVLGVGRRLADTDLAHESILSLSSSCSDYSEDSEDGEDDDLIPGRAPIRDSIRDSILDDRNIEVVSAASVRVQRLSPPAALNAARSAAYDLNQIVDGPQSPRMYASTPLSHMQHAFHTYAPSDHSGDVNATLRKLSGTSSPEHSASSTVSSTPEAAHIVAVTDEEMEFLEIMRKKRAEMQQVSFTEGYKIALQNEQQRLAKRTVSASKAALKVLQERERNEQSRHEQLMHEQERRPSDVMLLGADASVSETQRQLDDIRRAQVDERFQIERFLGMSSPNKPAPTVAGNSRPAEDLLPATVYCPMNASRGSSPLQGEPDAEDPVEVQRRVEQFIATQGAVPPLNNIRTMRRPSKQLQPPIHVIEQAMPPLAPLRNQRTRPASPEALELRSKVSVIHHSHAGMQRTSPVSAFPSHNPSPRSNHMPARFSPTLGTHPSQRRQQAVDPERPRTANGPVRRPIVPCKSLPRINTNEPSGAAQRHLSDDIRDGWYGFGGRRFTKPTGPGAQRFQT